MFASVSFASVQRGDGAVLTPEVLGCIWDFLGLMGWIKKFSTPQSLTATTYDWSFGLRWVGRARRTRVL